MRLIDADALKQKLNMTYKCVEVVRCKDCRWFLDNAQYCVYHYNHATDNGFCAWGREKR